MADALEQLTGLQEGISKAGELVALAKRFRAVAPNFWTAHLGSAGVKGLGDLPGKETQNALHAGMIVAAEKMEAEARAIIEGLVPKPIRAFRNSEIRELANCCGDGLEVVSA